MLKLNEIDYQSKNVNSISERLIIMNMTEEITKDIINDGRSILEKSQGAEVRLLYLVYGSLKIFLLFLFYFVKQGIERTLAEIENSRLNLMSYCIKENEENFELSQVVNNFYEKHNEVCLRNSCCFYFYSILFFLIIYITMKRHSAVPESNK